MASSYHNSIDEVIHLLEKESSAEPTLLARAQSRLDEIAAKYQNDESLGADRYKLYEAQALIHYREKNLSAARQWILEAENIAGEQYDFAENLIADIDSVNPSVKKELKNITQAGSVIRAFGWLILILGPGQVLIQSGISENPEILPHIYTFLSGPIGIYFIYAGRNIRYLGSYYIKRLLLLSCFLVLPFIFSILPILIFISAVTGYGSAKRLVKQGYRLFYDFEKGRLTMVEITFMTLLYVAGVVIVYGVV